MATYRGSGMASQRGELFGNRGSAFGYGAGAGAAGAGASQGNDALHNMYAEQNNQMTDHLGSQVSRLKELSVLISDEVNEQNSLLANMGNSFQSTGALMSGTLGKLQRMIDSGGSKHMCYLIMFVVGMFLFLYLFLLRR